MRPEGHHRVTDEPFSHQHHVELHRLGHGVGDGDVDGDGGARLCNDLDDALLGGVLGMHLDRVPHVLAVGPREGEGAAVVAPARHVDVKVVVALSRGGDGEGVPSGNAGEVRLNTIDHVGGGRVGHFEKGFVLPASSAVDHHVVLGKGLLPNALEGVDVAVVGDGVQHGQLPVDGADPVRPERQAVVGPRPGRDTELLDPREACPVEKAVDHPVLL
mmetsp:Transcript_28633/g.67694  ORF Transcript_28633/g.67694 Transcript_28633/m.67694 type:complete len:216 (-) Transcript_28633:41-688(-)